MRPGHVQWSQETFGDRKGSTRQIKDFKSKTLPRKYSRVYRTIDLIVFLF